MKTGPVIDRPRLAVRACIVRRVCRAPRTAGNVRCFENASRPPTLGPSGSDQHVIV
jgi:hypothetical protein